MQNHHDKNGFSAQIVGNEYYSLYIAINRKINGFMGKCVTISIVVFAKTKGYFVKSVHHKTFFQRLVEI
jgi:hypothetical protein